ncbi:hypothetical protein K2173_020816 [Erythroxylum novogranatense]|uniref:Uncharacterized protein n=1 Tax=Erythroxylum novogranatense TaxID=1862640 RepID=A0AAV8TLU2_9ROSI|nr:hypothetical protein K2173_020816 [Erythroxylum novogranatense]
MEEGLHTDAPLDYATVKIFPEENRYEVFACGNGEVEKLAVGQLDLLLQHLPNAVNLSAKGSNNDIKLQVLEDAKGATWLTKSTLNRFFNIVGSPDLINTAKIIQSEISQLEEARNFHVSLYAQGQKNRSEGGETDGNNSIVTTEAAKLEANIVSSDTSKNELVRAMNLRLTALRKELAAAIKQVAGFTCSSHQITTLIEFCENFGATALKCRQNSKISRPLHLSTPVKYGVSPAMVAQVERQSSTGSEESSDSSDDIQSSAERSRAASRSVPIRRSASPMRRVQIGRSGSRRATAVAIKNLGYYPAREKTNSHRDVVETSEEEGPEQLSKKLEDDTRRMTVQDAINLFERKQKILTGDHQNIISASKISLSANKTVLRRWSAGIAESIPSEAVPVLKDSDSHPSNDVLGTEMSDHSGEALESGFTTGHDNLMESAKDGVVLERTESKVNDYAHIETDANAIGQEIRNRKSMASAEGGRQKEEKLNQMLVKMMESHTLKTRKPQSNKTESKHNEQRGGSYNYYKEKRDEKLRGQNAGKRAEKKHKLGQCSKFLTRGIEMSSTNVKDSPSVSASSRKESPKTTVSSTISTLPATRKSWPSKLSNRTVGLSATKTLAGVSSAGAIPMRRKTQSTSSVPQTSAKVERKQPNDQNVKITRNTAPSNPNLKGMQDKVQQMRTGGKAMKKKITAVDEDRPQGTAPPKLNFCKTVTKKSSVVPVESKPFLRKKSDIHRGADHTMNKTKHSSQLEESSNISGTVSISDESKMVVNASDFVDEYQDEPPVSLGEVNIASESEKLLDGHQNCGKVENFDELATHSDCGPEHVVESSDKIVAEEEPMISPTLWVEAEVKLNLPNSDNVETSQPTTAVEVQTIGRSNLSTRHSLFQMLQEDISEPDTTEWGNAENPPTMIYQKDAPKGLKRLLNFARKSKVDANVTSCSSPSVFSEAEDDSEEFKSFVKKNTDITLGDASHNPKDHVRQKASFFASYDTNVDAHELLSAQGSVNVQSSHKLARGHISTTSSTTKGPRSFFSLSAFRGSKPNETKFQ